MIRLLITQNLCKSIRTINFFRCVTNYDSYTVDPFIKHYSSLLMRANRRKFLNKTVLNQNKCVIYAPLRKPQETVIGLKKQGKCPGVIRLRSKQDVDIVLQGSLLKSMMRHSNFGRQTVYVRVEGNQYRCILKKAIHHYENFIEKVVLVQYVPGQPNEMSIPIEITHLSENSYIQRGCDFNFKIREVEIICFNDEYPMQFHVDISYANPDRPYRLGDLANTLPPGLVLGPKMDPNNIVLFVDDLIELDRISKEKILKSVIESDKKLKESNSTTTANKGQISTSTSSTSKK